jgi:hypothetical protein
MNFQITIRYSVDSTDYSVNNSINAILENTLPYMVDNVDIHFDVEEK